MKKKMDFCSFVFPKFCTSKYFHSKLESHTRAQQSHRVGDSSPARSQRRKTISAHYESCIPSITLGKREVGFFRRYCHTRGRLPAFLSTRTRVRRTRGPGTRVPGYPTDIQRCLHVKLCKRGSTGEVQEFNSRTITNRHRIKVEHI